MPKRISKRPSDVNQAAHLMVERSTTEPEIEVLPSAQSPRSEISRIMAEMGRKGGRIGGKRRLKTMTKAERSEVAAKAAKARWKKAKR
jgi:hypothetical protein